MTVRSGIGPLSGIRIFDFSRVIAGPYGATLLSQMGADVIRVERPAGAEDRSIGLLTDQGERLSTAAVISHSKKGVTLDLKSPKASFLLDKMARSGDIILHNYSPGSRQARLFDYNRLSKINPRLILAAVSGFGQSGPYAPRPCFDNVAQAMSGMMSYTGFPGSAPLKAAVPLVDFGAALHAALGMLAALFERERSGMGQCVDVALFDVAASYVMQSSVAAEYQSLGVLRQPFGNCGAHAYSVCSKTADGWIYLNPLGARIWERFLRAMAREDLMTDERFSDDNRRLDNRAALDQIIEDWTRTRLTADIVETMESFRVPCGAVNGVPELFKDPQLKAREMLVPVDYPGFPSLTVSGPAVKLSRTPSMVKGPAPTIGQHNAEVYCGLLGLNPEELAELSEQGVI